MGRGADPSRTVDAEPDVATVRSGRLTGVQSHPDADGHALGPAMACERALSGECRRDGVLGTREDDEEGVSLRVDLAPAGLGEGVAQQALVVGE